MSEPNTTSDTSVPASAPVLADSANRRKRFFLFSALALAIAAAGGGYYTYWTRVGSRYVSTDDAYTAAEPAVVTAQIDGPVAAVNVTDSQQVKRGDVLIVIDDPTPSFAAPGEGRPGARPGPSGPGHIRRRALGVDLQRRRALVASGSVSGDELTKVINGASDPVPRLTPRAPGGNGAGRAECPASIWVARSSARPVEGVIARREVQLGQRVQPSTPLLVSCRSARCT